MNKSAALIFSAILSCPSLAFSGTITEDMSIR